MNILITTLLPLVFRFSLALTFFWIGALKLFHLSTLSPLIETAYPFLGTPQSFAFLGILEIIIGIGLIVGKKTSIFATFLILHLVATLLTFVFAPSTVFKPFFPILTMEGEFILKNVVLIVGALFVLLGPSYTAKKAGEAKESKKDKGGKDKKPAPEPSPSSSGESLPQNAQDLPGAAQSDNIESSDRSKRPFA